MARSFADTLLVDLSINGVMGTAMVDTGSPVVALDPARFPGSHLLNGLSAVKSLAVGALSFTGASVVGTNLFSSPDPSVPLGGSLGCDILCHFGISLNYRDTQLTFGSSPLPPNISDQETRVPFTLEGGGMEWFPDVQGSVLLPASRILVRATIEGRDNALLVDTGSSLVLLRRALISQLASDGRAELGGVGTIDVGSQSSSSVIRLRSVIVDGAEVDGLVASEDPAIEGTLDSLGVEVGHSVDGLLGGSFLRHFYTTIDYPAGVLHLRSYLNEPTFDQFDSVGFAISVPAGGGPAKVTEVFGGTDASAKGVSVGDEIISVDGQPLASLATEAANDALTGPVGSVKMIECGMAASSGLSMQTVALQVDDLLRLP